jgi:hypothetical protein
MKKLPAGIRMNGMPMELFQILACAGGGLAQAEASSPTDANAKHRTCSFGKYIQRPKNATVTVRTVTMVAKTILSIRAL